MTAPATMGRFPYVTEVLAVGAHLTTNRSVWAPCSPCSSTGGARAQASSLWPIQ